MQLSVTVPQCPPTQTPAGFLLLILARRGLTKLFHNLGVLAWAVVLAKGSSLLLPVLGENPLLEYIADTFSHEAADVVLEGQEVLIQLLAA